MLSPWEIKRKLTEVSACRDKIKEIAFMVSERPQTLKEEDWRRYRRVLAAYQLKRKRYFVNYTLFGVTSLTLYVLMNSRGLLPRRSVVGLFAILSLPCVLPPILAYKFHGELTGMVADYKAKYPVEKKR